MATTTNGNGNLMDEFEEAFQSCLNVLTKDDALSSMDKDEIRVEMDQPITRFLDLARQMEAFFLQKRFLLSALKPELVVKEDIIELKTELVRKDELIKKHYEKIGKWQNLLSDIQSQGWNKSPGQSTATTMPNGQHQQPVVTPMQMQQQQMQQAQQLQHQQQMHQQMQQQMQQQSMGGGPIVSPQQAMFMQQGPRGPYAGQGPGVGLMPGPLAYLEKTTSNIGMPDGRR